MKNENTENQNDTLSLYKRLKSSRILCVTLALIVVFIVGFSGFAAYSAVYSKIIPNTQVGDTAIGSMTPSEAKELLNEQFVVPLADRKLLLRCNDSSEVVSFSDLGVTVDIDSTVDAAFNIGRKGMIFSKSAALFCSAFKKSNVELAVNADSQLIDTVISRLAEEYEVDVKNTAYELDGNHLTIIKGDNGMKVNRDYAVNAIIQAARNAKTSEIVFKVEPAEPDRIDVDRLYNELSQEPKDAYYKLENGEVIIVDEVPQVIVEKEELEKAFASKEKTYTLDVRTVVPEKNAAVLSELLFRDTLASYSSGFASSSAARAANVNISASRINGYILMPGDVFSYDRTIGKRTVANGYREAGVYIGNKVESGIGGGICQTSSTLYSAALYANLEIVTRTSHSLPVSYVPGGQDATIAEGYIDLKLKNNTDYPIKFVAVVSGRTLTCKILGVKTPNQTVEIVHSKIGDSYPKTERTVNAEIPKGYKKIVNKGAPGYSIASKRIVRVGGEVVKTEGLSKSVYHAANVEEEVNPDDINTPSETLKVYTGEISTENDNPPSIPTSDNELPVEADKIPPDSDSGTSDGDNSDNSQPSPDNNESEVIPAPIESTDEKPDETVEVIGIE